MKDESISEIMPEALRQLSLKVFLCAVICLVMSICFALTFGNIKYLSIALIAVFLGFKGASITLEYKKGNVVEDVLICQNVRKAALKDKTIVTFSTSEDNPRYMQFTMAGMSQLDTFTIGATYLVYYNAKNPKTMLTHYTV